MALSSGLKLRTPIYSETAAYGHMGRTSETITKTFKSPYSGEVSLQGRAFYLGETRSS